jgi:hypothetical protein
MLRAETPQEQFNLIGAGRRNWLINGDFQVSQRGAFTTASTYAANTYYVDRWKGGVSGSFTSQRNLNQTLPNGKITTSYRVTSTGGAYAGIQQWIEDYSVFSGQLATFSFWAKTNKAGCSASFYTVANQFNVVSDIVADEQWHYYQATALVPTGGTAMRPEVWTGTGASSGDYLELAQVQLELGKVATPFEHRSYGEELALCQRYFQVLGGSSGECPFIGQSSSTSNASATYQFPVSMRTGPTASTPDYTLWTWLVPASTFGAVWSSFSTIFANSRSIFISANCSANLSTGAATICQAASPSARIYFDAEL